MKDEKVNTMIGFRVTESFRNKLVILARKDGRTLQEFITRAIKAYLQRADNSVNEYDKSFDNAADLIKHLKD